MMRIFLIALLAAIVCAGIAIYALAPWQRSADIAFTSHPSVVKTHFEGGRCSFCHLVR
jgi:hypothetical protein